MVGYIYILLKPLSANLSEDVIHPHRVKMGEMTLLDTEYDKLLYYFLMSLKTEAQIGIF